MSDYLKITPHLIKICLILFHIFGSKGYPKFKESIMKSKIDLLKY